jgi:uncharacterized damage-inducible protein DinB
MKIIFQSFAKYNKVVNQEILKLVEPMPKEKIFQKSKAYYPAIFDSMSHIFNTDIAWLRRYKTALPENKALAESSLLKLDKDAVKKEIEEDYAKLFKYRKELDETTLRFIEELDEDKLNSIIKFTNNRGEQVEKELWKLLLQWFNHQTHHRGQISVQLDMVDVFNDYSSLLNKI